jgi:Arc/MetJ-type ribon-helix-helix transcriptional regulator
MPKLVTVRVSESQREKLFERAKANGFRQLSDFIRSRLEIDLDND